MLPTHLCNASTGRMVSALARMYHRQLVGVLRSCGGSSTRSLATTCSLKSAGADQQQSAAQAAAEHSVLDTMKLLEAGTGPLSQLPMVPPPRARVIVISGPSGVGKDAVLRRLQELRPDLYFVVTATSRAMRPGEVEGKDYFFVNKEKFESWIHSGQLLEHAVVYGEYKGIPRQQVDAALQKGSNVVLRIDVQGAATVRKLMPDVISVFLVAESEAQLVARLVSRKTEPLDKMLTRVKTARWG
eukprot:GHUV01051765.1.p1 GENE.GHUV01051765.1~~GHUV01051765.1.p1  ORF type:complete len:243 (+),score=67.17 GHUV01051765.1:356-1084(+)